jgi:hypothetical protein
MELETLVVSFKVDGNLQAEMDRLAAGGWQLRPDIPPVTVYHLVRVKPASVGEGTMRIDEDKVFVMGADGVIRKN